MPGVAWSQPRAGLGLQMLRAPYTPLLTRGLLERLAPSSASPSGAWGLCSMRAKPKLSSLTISSAARRSSKVDSRNSVVAQRLHPLKLVRLRRAATAELCLLAPAETRPQSPALKVAIVASACQTHSLAYYHSRYSIWKAQVKGTPRENPADTPAAGGGRRPEAGRHACRYLTSHSVSSFPRADWICCPASLCPAQKNPACDAACLAMHSIPVLA